MAGVVGFPFFGFQSVPSRGGDMLFPFFFSLSLLSVSVVSVVAFFAERAVVLFA